MSSSKKERILLVDDEKNLLISLSDYLASENFEVILAQSGEEALEQLEKTGPDLIVLDISMPGIGGLGFLKKISKEGGKPSHPVLVLTARSTMEDFFKTVEVDGFLGKPCEETELVRKIREILEKKKTVEAKKERAQKIILLGEDDESIASEMKDALEDSGYKIEIAGTGPEVLEKASTIKPDLLLLKEILPRLNGSAVVSLIEVMPSINMIPVVIYDESLSDGEDTSPRYKKLKCIKKIIKSANTSDILDAVGQTLR
ncbi:response regulator [Verrucomicrobiota bacterium]